MRNQADLTKYAQSEKERLKNLSNSIGDFIRYWGFRRIHGQIWTQVFLSKTELSGAELTKRLGVSKALVSPALAELESYGLIIRLQEDGKTKRYKANPNVVEVIRSILEKREAQIIENVARHLRNLDISHSKVKNSESNIDSERLEELGQMVNLSQVAIEFIIGQSKHESIQSWLEQKSPSEGEKL